MASSIRRLALSEVVLVKGTREVDGKLDTFWEKVPASKVNASRLLILDYEQTERRTIEQLAALDGADPSDLTVDPLSIRANLVAGA